MWIVTICAIWIFFKVIPSIKCYNKVLLKIITRTNKTIQCTWLGVL